MSTFQWMKRKIKGIDYARMNQFVDLISKNSGKPKWYIRLDIFKNFLQRGIGYTDYFRGDYIHLTKEEKKTFVTTKSFYQLISYLNDEKYEIILHDKLLFNAFYHEYLGRNYLNLKTCSYEEFENFVQDRQVIFAKTCVGEGGHGVSRVIIDSNTNIKKLYQDLIQKKQFLIEEAIIQCDAVNEINPNAVNCFRVVTLYKDGEVTILNNAFRINQDQSEIIGCTNDLYFSLNEEGIIDSNVIDDYGNIYKEHPLTKKKFSEVKIPNVKEAFELCKRAALKLPQVRYIGWDIAFTNQGPILIEGNEYPGYGLLQFYKLKNKRTGHLKEISDVLGSEMKKIKL